MDLNQSPAVDDTPPDGWLHRNGYTHIRRINGVVVGLHDYLTTRAIVVDIKYDSPGRRYCYQDREAANQALAIWDGIQHPSGNWIKLKGLWQGQFVDFLNPQWSRT